MTTVGVSLLLLLLPECWQCDLSINCTLGVTPVHLKRWGVVDRGVGFCVFIVQNEVLKYFLCDLGVMTFLVAYHP